VIGGFWELPPQHRLVRAELPLSVVCEASTRSPAGDVLAGALGSHGRPLPGGAGGFACWFWWAREHRLPRDAPLRAADARRTAMLYLVTWLSGSWWRTAEPARPLVPGVCWSTCYWHGSDAPARRRAVLAFHLSFGTLESSSRRVTWLALKPENAPVRRALCWARRLCDGIAAWFVDSKACTWWAYLPATASPIRSSTPGGSAGVDRVLPLARVSPSTGPAAASALTRRDRLRRLGVRKRLQADRAVS